MCHHAAAVITNLAYLVNDLLESHSRGFGKFRNINLSSHAYFSRG
jgi:hypothetical protein